MRGAELVHGVHAVISLLEHDPAGLLEVWIAEARRDARADRLGARAAELGVAVHRAPRRTLDRMAPDVRHQGVLARYRPTRRDNDRDLQWLVEGIDEGTLILALDEVHDPHNLGACLRSAAGAGARAVLVPRSRSATITPAVRKVASGGAELVPLIRVPNLARALAALADAGVQVIGADASAGTSIHDAGLRGPLAIVLGSESSGLRRLTRERCDALVHIPTTGAVESLNVSVAAGVLLFEALRQRHGARPG